MWKDHSQSWQTAFSEMWTAFCAGSTPIGAVLCDADGNVILRDRNRNHEPQTVNRRLAHAEANMLRALDTSVFDPKQLTLYSTMEPCPMCMGTILMCNIKRVRSAARDTYCGMTHLTLTEPYYISKNTECTFAGGELEQVQLTVQAYYELRHMEKGAGGYVFEKFREHCPAAADAAQRLFETKRLDKAAADGTDISEVFDLIVNEIAGREA